MLETLALSILNHDSAIASAAARMVTAAAGRPIIEMGSRRTHEAAAVAAARAAYLAGFAATSNLEAERRHGIPTAGTAAHALVLLHDDEQAAFESQVKALGAGTTLLVDTYDIRQRHRAGRARGRAGARRRPHRLRRPRRARPPGPRAARRARRDEHPDRGLRRPRRVRDRRAARRARSTPTASARRWSPARARRPRAWSTSWWRSTGEPVAKRSAARSRAAAASRRCAGSSRRARRSRRSCTPRPRRPRSARTTASCRCRWCAAASSCPAVETLEQSRERLRAALVSVPWEGLKLSRGEPAIPTVFA